MKSYVEQHTINEFLYELYQRNSDFPEHVLRLLNKYFGFENIGFFCHKKLDFFDDSSPSEEDNTIMFSKEILECTYALQNSDLVLDHYNKLFYSMDSMTYYKLPQNLQNQNIIDYSQVPHGPHEDPYTEFKESLSLKHFLCLYLFSEENSYLGRIALCKTNEKGKFTENELQLLSIISKHISHSYSNYLKYSSTALRLEMMNKILLTIPLGTILLDSRFNIIFSNNLACDCCAEILEITSNDVNNINKKNLSFKDQQKVVNSIVDTMTAINNKFQNTINTYYATYSIMIVPCITHNRSNNIETLYYMYIQKQLSSTRVDLETFAQKYNLTHQELNIIQLVQEGCSSIEISEKLYISKHTVKSHFTNIYRKLNISNRVSLLHKISDTIKESADQMDALGN